ncbi:nuclear speckle splicing regulatory protein 1-like [Brevipalpus obovatus]|uniref:nuclear speckle splicing regulatory protein 1-like n=1 Tax=Brevipalpus obovatus TaxID=246614 RepID=UPI003D9F7D1E
MNKNLAKANLKKALEEDPSIFQYDEVYDEIKEDKKERSEPSQKEEPKKTSRYVESLLKTAERRKREQERRYSRKAQKEIEDEKEVYGEVETFVTSSYKEKLKEMKALEEKEKMEIALEQAMDVKKQKDLSGFYRYFLNNKLHNEKVAQKDSEKEAEGKSSPTKASTSNVTEMETSSSEVTKKSDSVDEECRKNENETKESNPTTEPIKPSTSGTDNDSKQEVQVDREELLKKVFEKRTVGEVFDAALQRFHERSSMSTSV